MPSQSIAYNMKLVIKYGTKGTFAYLVDIMCERGV